MTGMRVGVIDVGSNTVRLLVASVDGDVVRTVREEREHLGLGEEILRHGRVRRAKLDEVGRRDERVRAHRAQARRARARDRRHRSRPAGRHAERLLDAIGRATAAEVRVVSAEDEGRLAFAGAVSRARHRRSDRGGVRRRRRLDGDRRRHRAAGPRLGALGRPRLAAADGGAARGDPPQPAEIDAARSAVRDAFAAVVPPRPEAALATGGSARAIARVIGHDSAPDELRARRRAPRRASGGRERGEARPPPHPRAHAARGRARSSPRSRGCSASASRPPAAGSARELRSGSRRAASRPSRLARERLVEQLDVARVREQRPRLVGRQPAQLVDLVGRLELARDAVASATSARASAAPSRRDDASSCSSSPSSQRRPVSSSTSRSAQSSSLSPGSAFPFGNDQSSYSRPVHDDDRVRRGRSRRLRLGSRLRRSSRAASTRPPSRRGRALRRAPARARSAARRRPQRPAAARRARAAAPRRRPRPGARRARPGAPSRRLTYACAAAGELGRVAGALDLDPHRVQLARPASRAASARTALRSC